MRPDLEGLVSTFDEWLILPDRVPLFGVLGAVAGNLLEGPPLWFMLVGPPASAKTELLRSLSRLPDVYGVGTLTEAALLSGSPARERSKDSNGGLLRAIGDFGILSAKDFGTVFSMHGDTRTKLLAALREVYDGNWHRDVGVDGGRRLEWRGKVGFLGACTEEIDRHHQSMSSLGERFVMLRLRPHENPREATRRALQNTSKSKAMTGELAAAVEGLLGPGRNLHAVVPHDVETEERLIDLCSFVAQARSPIIRDSWSREIEWVPQQESPTRLAGVFERLFSGLTAIGLEGDEVWSVVARVGLDSMPANRLAAAKVLLRSGPLTDTALHPELRVSRSAATRLLADLAGLRIAEPVKGQGYALNEGFAAELSRWLRVSEKSDDTVRVALEAA